MSLNNTENKSANTVEVLTNHFRIIMEFGSHYASFGLYDIHYNLGPDNPVDESNLTLEGNIRWDHCANFSTGDINFHTCDKSHIHELAIALDLVYELAEQHIENWMKS